MWNKRRDEEPVRTTVTPTPPVPGPSVPPAPVAPIPQETKKEALPVSSPVGRLEPESRSGGSTSSGGSATIGKAVKIIGQINSKEDLYVHGDGEGTVEAMQHKLTIGPNAAVHAAVKAREVAVRRNSQGDVDATDKIEIRKDVLTEHDGPTLQHALQGLHGVALSIPARRAERPDKDLLEQRFERFLAAS